MIIFLIFSFHPEYTLYDLIKKSIVTTDFHVLSQLEENFVFIKVK